MTCPRCETQSLIRIQTKKTDKAAELCVLCGIYWLNDEVITAHTGHDILSRELGEELEYTIDTHESNVMYPKNAHVVQYR